MAGRDHSSKELRRKLLAKGYDEGDIAEAVDRLAEQGMQSDAGFAVSYTEARARKGFGPLRVRAELRERGVDESTVDEAIRESEVDWLDVLQHVHDKKFGGGKPADLKEKSARVRFLQYRGFDSDAIRELF